MNAITNSGDADDNNNTSTGTPDPEPSPPAAPVKLRRRRPFLLEKLRSRRRQMLLQHPSNNSSTVTNNTFQRRPPRSLVEDYYRVDSVVSTPRVAPVAAASATLLSSDGSAITLQQQQQQQLPVGKRVKVVLPGVPRYEEDWARDSHDFFNLIVLVPVTVLNIMNWNWDVLFAKLSAAKNAEAALLAVQAAWTGDWFDVFFAATAAYFIIDLLWIVLVPVCVKSPSVILQHHLAVLFYIMIPYHHTAVRYCMGACMTVEINTWFLIARRVFNKQGFPPWTVFNSSWLSIRVKVISVFFYLTWISIRCLLYPALLVLFYRHWRDLSRQKGTVFNILLPSVPLHAAFCLLNLKWSYELLMSKLRYVRRHRLYQQQQRRNTANNGHGRQPSLPDPSISSGL